jgi:anhydro-N-acetylmuramic acid kinase
MIFARRMPHDDRIRLPRYILAMSERLIAGAMSGTSADGVDVAIVGIDGRGLGMTATIVQHHHEPYVRELRERILSIRQGGPLDLGVLAGIGRAISLTYASAIFGAMEAANLQLGALTAIAAHGQTLFHRPPDTIQWLDPALLASETRCRVISDFRRADCAAGGQGAPLVPFADFVLFRHATIHRAIVNIGGIANVTLIPAAAGLDQLLAFDTGPWNCISDFLVRSHNPSGPGYDAGGRLAGQGTVNTGLLDAVSQQPYFQSTGPKSTDGPEMVRTFTEAVRRLALQLRVEDLLTTACALSASQIARAINPPITEVYVSGGGTKNATVMRMLAERLTPGTVVRSTGEIGVIPQAREAVAFALLGAATLDGIPANVRSCTGASRAVVLGCITPRP